jgi:hypothetical protein
MYNVNPYLYIYMCVNMMNMRVFSINISIYIYIYLLYVHGHVYSQPVAMLTVLGQSTGIPGNWTNHMKLPSLQLKHGEVQ